MRNFRYSLMVILCSVMMFTGHFECVCAQEDEAQETSVEIEGQCLKGAVLRITDESGNVVDEWMTDDASHSLVGLVAGQTYTLTEITPAPGYATAKPITFTVKDSSDIQKIVMADEPILFDFMITDEAAATPVSGAALRLVDGDGKEVISWTSGDTPYRVKYLVAGQTYTLEEIKPAPGYATAKPVTFCVEDTSQVQTIDMVGEMTKIAVYKVDADTGASISAAVLEVCDSEAHIIKRWETADLPYELTYLTAGEKYILKEVQPSTGYVQADDVRFKVMDTGEIQNIVMESEKDLVPAGLITSGIDFSASGISGCIDGADTVETGDTFNRYIPVGVMLVSLSVFIGILYMRKLKNIY